MIRQRGFNLIEFMIAMTIGLILMLSLTSMFVDTKVSANRSTTVSNLQSQAKLAVQILLEDIRNIGSWAEFSGQSLGDIKVPASINLAAGSCTVLQTANASSAASTMSLPTNANWIADAGANPGAVIGGNCLPKNGYNITAESDVLSLSRIQGSLVQTADLISGAYYLAVSSQQAQLFNTASPNGATSIVNVELYPYIHHTYLVESHATEGTRLSRYSLRESGGNAVFSNDLIIDNIERIRIEFGVDTGADGVADSYLTSADVTNAMWNGNQIVSARIYVLARATLPDASFTNNQTYNLGSDPVPVDDNYRRFLLSTTVIIENNVMVATQ